MIVIETPRLNLRHFEPTDAPALEAVFCDPAVMRFGGPPRTSAWIRDIVAQTIDRDYPEFGFGRYAVIAKDTGQLIASCGLLHERWPAGEAEVAYRFVPSSWGNGYATEAATAVCNYAFDTVGLRSVFACIDPGNTGSINVAKKLGMTFDRELPARDEYNPPEHSYVITREQFAAAR